MAPSYNSAKKDTTESTSNKTKSAMMKERDEESYVKLTSKQVWQKSGSCPKGTIPVRRIGKRELLKAPSIDEFGRKKPSFLNRKVNQLNQNIDSFVLLKNHSVSFYACYSYKMLDHDLTLFLKHNFLLYIMLIKSDDLYSEFKMNKLKIASNLLALQTL